MNPDKTHTCDEELLRQLPLPLAQLYRRAHNAKTPLERHQAAYYLWEASLKLLGSVAIVEYAELGDQDPELAERLRNLVRPALGHWWEFVRRLVPILADAGPEYENYQALRDLVLGRIRDDLPWAAGLDAQLNELLETGRGSRSTVRLSELFERLVRYRNREFGHGAAGQRSGEFYGRMGHSLLSGVAEILRRLDVLAGRRLLYVADVRRQASGRWLVERYALKGESARRIESLEVPETEVASLPHPERVYLQAPVSPSCPPLFAALRSLHPLVLFIPDAEEVYFLNSRRGQLRVEYLCYSSGNVVEKEELGTEHRELLGSVLGVPVDRDSIEAWAERSRTEEPSEEAVDTGPPRRRVGEFELLSRIGHGGMGVVYRAWQPSLGRQVALKCLFSAGDPKVEARFAREIRSLGRVEHPNLVKIFTSGSDGDQWFYAMELIEGAELASVGDQLAGSSASEIGEVEWRRAVSSAWTAARQREEDLTPGSKDKASSPMPVEEKPPPGDLKPRIPVERAYIDHIVDIIRQVAGAVHALHEAGVVHRDIKPGNIMLTQDGSHAVLMDLGLAQLADDEQGRLTRTRQFVGTLRYASPEQVLAAAILNRRSDIYSLGATLWELLTLRPLFGADDQTPTPDLMLKIQTTEPDRPRRFNPRIPADLEAIILKCLEKDRNRRYATAAELVEDLTRWQRGDVVYAQPPTLRYVVGKYIRRYRIRLGGATALVIALLILAFFSVYRIDRARRATEVALFDMYTSSGLEATEEKNLAQAYLWYANAASLAQDDSERQWANQVRLRTWHREIALPLRVFPVKGPPIQELEFHRSGRYLLASADEDGNSALTIWDLMEDEPLSLPGGERPLTCAAFRPDGNWLALGTPDGTVEVFEFPGGKPLELIRHTGPIETLAFSSDGALLALASKTARVWDCRSRRFVTRDLSHPEAVRQLVFNSRGDRLATGCRDGLARVFSISGADDPQPLFEPLPNVLRHQRVQKPLFIDEDRGLLTLTKSTIVTWWDAETGAEIRPISLNPAIDNDINCFISSPDQRYFAVCGSDGAMLWDAVLGCPVNGQLHHPNSIISGSFSPEGTKLLTAGNDRKVRLWDVPSGKLLASVPHEVGIRCAVFSPDALFFATAQYDNLLRLWRWETSRSGDYRLIREMIFSYIVLSRDGRHFLPVGRLWDSPLKATRPYETETGKPVGPPLELEDLLMGGSFSPDGIHVMILGPETVQYWNWKSGEKLFEVGDLPSRPDGGVAFSPDGLLAVVLCREGELLLIDVSKGSVTRQLHHGEPVSSPSFGFHHPTAIRFSSSGGMFTSRGGNLVNVWNSQTGERLYRPLKHRNTCKSDRFSWDGTLLVTGSLDREAVIWDLFTGEPAAPPLVHPAEVNDACFHPDEPWVLTACGDHFARIFHWKTGELVCPPLEHSDTVLALDISPGGRWTFTVSRDGFLRLWECRTGKPIGQPRPLYGFSSQAALTPDGSHLLTTSGAGGLNVFDLGELMAPLGETYDPHSLRILGEILSGQRVHEMGGLINLTSREWLDRWNAFRKENPGELDSDFSLEEILDWHRRRLELCENTLEWDAAAWHVKRLVDLGERQERERLLGYQEFARAWRFPRDQVVPWTDTEDFVEVDDDKLQSVELASQSEKLIRSRGPFIDFVPFYPNRSTFLAGYAVRTVICDHARKVTMFIGSDDAIRVWINRKLILKNSALRPASPDQDKATADLAPGENSLIIEISQSTGEWGFYLRFEDAEGQKLKLTDDGKLEPLVFGSR